MEIITRGERRRSWTLAEKQDIVAESLGPDLTPTAVARKHAISFGQLYTSMRAPAALRLQSQARIVAGR
jgi:transposase